MRGVCSQAVHLAAAGGLPSLCGVCTAARTMGRTWEAFWHSCASRMRVVLPYIHVLQEEHRGLIFFFFLHFLRSSFFFSSLLLLSSSLLSSSLFFSLLLLLFL